ncbi:MAG: class I SAM-dependent methyltransferase [Deltaproteobacteria bacterium]|nr:class I SAM-dependent methyltransferase [Deltaproteobacteria bacterium]
MSRCPVCGNGSAPLCRVGAWTYLSCPSCGVAWLDGVAGAPEAPALYDEAYFRGAAHGGYPDYLADEELHRRNARDRLGWISEAGLAVPGALLDVGCAAGFVLDEARIAGWRVAGVDLSPFAIRVARDRFGLRVWGRLAEVDAPDGTFDVVTFFQVLEHMPDPAAALAKAARLLRPGGLLLVETWDRDSLVARWLGRLWQQVTPPSVVFLFGRESLGRLLAVSGFGEITSRAVAKRVRLRHALALLADKHPRLLGPVARGAARLRLDRLAVPYRLGDLVIVTAIRR